MGAVLAWHHPAPLRRWMRRPLRPHDQGPRVMLEQAARLTAWLAAGALAGAAAAAAIARHLTR